MRKFYVIFLIIPISLFLFSCWDPIVETAETVDSEFDSLAVIDSTLPVNGVVYVDSGTFLLEISDSAGIESVVIAHNDTLFTELPFDSLMGYVVTYHLDDFGVHTFTIIAADKNVPANYDTLVISLTYEEQLTPTQLLAPFDGYAGIGEDGFLEFLWSQVEMVDTLNTVSYLLQYWKDSSQVSMIKTQDTSVSLNTALFEKGELYSWDVQVISKLDTISSSNGPYLYNRNNTVTQIDSLSDTLTVLESDSFTVSVEAQDIDGVSEYQWTFNGTTTSTGLQSTINLKAPAILGEYPFVVTVYDSIGGETADTAVVKVVLNTPSVIDDFPTKSISINDAVSYTLNVSDPQGVEKCKWYVDGVYKGESSGGTMTIDSVSKVVGTVNVKIEALDGKNQSTFKEGNIDVTNNAPVVSCKVGTSIFLDDSVTLSMSATDEDAVLTYEWLVDGIWVLAPEGEIAVTPKDYVAPSQFEYIGRVTDGDGNVAFCTTSVSITLNVSVSSFLEIPELTALDKSNVVQVGERYVVVKKAISYTANHGSFLLGTISFSNNLQDWTAFSSFSEGTLSSYGKGVGFFSNSNKCVQVTSSPTGGASWNISDYEITFNPLARVDGATRLALDKGWINNTFEVVGFERTTGTWSDAYMFFGVYSTDKYRDNYTFLDTIFLYSQQTSQSISWKAEPILNIEMLEDNTPYHVDGDTLTILHGRTSRTLTKYQYYEETLSVLAEVNNITPALDGESTILKVQGNYYLLKGNEIYRADFGTGTCTKVAIIGEYEAADLLAAVTYQNRIICYTTKGQFEISL